MDHNPETAGVFINYRRLNDLATAGRLFDNLKNLLPEASIFMDVESLPAGRDFVAELTARIAHCKVFLLVIGEGWHNAVAENGLRRLDLPNDFVRFEIETALRLGKAIVPLLIGDAKMPKAGLLPSSISAIANLNAVTIRHENFTRDCQSLVDKIKPTLGALSSVRLEELDAFRMETSLARKYVAERPPTWEYLLAAELWETYLKGPLRRLDDITSGLYSIRQVPLIDDQASLSWIGEQLGAATGMINPLQKLMTVELKRAWGDPGVPGDPREILHVSKLLQRAAIVIMEWEENIRSRRVTDKFRNVYDLLPGIAARQLYKVKDLPSELIRRVELALADPGQPHTIHFNIFFDLPEGWEKKFQQELGRLDKGLNRW